MDWKLQTVLTFSIGRRKEDNDLVEKMGIPVFLNNVTTENVTSAFA